MTAQPEGAPDSHRYSLTLGKEPGNPVRWHLLARDGALFLTDRPAVFDRIGAAGPRLAAPPGPPAAPGRTAPVVLHYAAGLSALPGLLEPLQRLLPEPAGALAGAGTDAGRARRSTRPCSRVGRVPHRNALVGVPGAGPGLPPGRAGNAPPREPSPRAPPDARRPPGSGICDRGDRMKPFQGVDFSASTAC